MRAFRPSHFAPYEGADEEKEQVKQANVIRYAARAEAGLPLFETPAAADNKSLISLPFIPGRT